MLYTRTHDLFIIELMLVSLNLKTYTSSAHFSFPLLPSGNHPFVLCMYESFFILFLFFRIHMWEHALFVFVFGWFHLVEFPLDPYMLSQMTRINFYGLVIFHTHMCVFIYIPHLFYPVIYWWALCYFCNLVIINNVAVDIGVHIAYISVFLPLDKYPEVEFLDHIVIPLLIFWGPSILFSMVAIPIYIPTNSEQRFSFIHILARTCYLWKVCLIRCIVYSECKISVYMHNLYLTDNVICLLYHYFLSVLYQMNVSVILVTHCELYLLVLKIVLCQLPCFFAWILH